MICFRADGNAHIGSGHIMRCLSLAAALRTLGEDCLFAMADDTMAATVRSRGFEVRFWAPTGGICTPNCRYFCPWPPRQSWWWWTVMPDPRLAGGGTAAGSRGAV